MKKNEKLFKCVLCEKTHKNKYDAKNHVQSVHQKIKEECSICGILSSKNYVTQHIKTDYEGKNYPCTFCGKISMSRNAKMEKLKKKICQRDRPNHTDLFPKNLGKSVLSQNCIKFTLI